MFWSCSPVLLSVQSFFLWWALRVRENGVRLCACACVCRCNGRDCACASGIWSLCMRTWKEAHFSNVKALALIRRAEYLILRVSGFPSMTNEHRMFVLNRNCAILAYSRMCERNTNHS
jgi:hypothetical protein